MIGNIILLVVGVITFLISFATGLWMYQTIVRKFFREKQLPWTYDTSKYPHENFPEILEWERNDEFVREIPDPGYSTITKTITCQIGNINTDGTMAIVKEWDRDLKDSPVEVLPIELFMQKWENDSLRKRNKRAGQEQLRSKIARGGDDYHQFLHDFRKAYNEVKS